MRLAPKLYCARWLVIQTNVLILVSVDIKCEGRGPRGPCDTLFMTDLGGGTCIIGFQVWLFNAGTLLTWHIKVAFAF